LLSSYKGEIYPVRQLHVSFAIFLVVPPILPLVLSGAVEDMLTA